MVIFKLLYDPLLFITIILRKNDFAQQVSCFNPVPFFTIYTNKMMHRHLAAGTLLLTMQSNPHLYSAGTLLIYS